MQSDAYTRAALTAIAVLLLMLVVRSFASGTFGATSDDEGIAGDSGRYGLQNVRMGRATTVLRIDSETGDTWQLQGRGDDLAWQLMREGDEAEEAEEAEAAEASAASEPSAPAEDPAAAPQQKLTREQLNQALDRLRGGPTPAGRPAQGQLPPGHPATAGGAQPGEAAEPPGGGEAEDPSGGGEAP
jgi:hypothetical protein